MRKIILLIIISGLLFTACSNNGAGVSKTGTSTAEAVVTVPDGLIQDPEGSGLQDGGSSKQNNESLASKKEQMESTVFKPEKPKDITDVFKEAIPLFVETLQFDPTLMKLQGNEAELTALNSYYEATRQNTDLKYAYSVEPKYVSSTGIVKCSIKYMPYKTGAIDANNLPDGTYRIGSLKDLIKAVDESGVRKNTPIAITNPSLDVDTMQRALMQTGYGYLVFSLNNDATGIIAMPTNGRTMEQCTGYIAKTDVLADEILKKIITDGMTPDEKIGAIYRYITDNVVYDQRYYTNKKAMPYESTTAYGALKDNKAICGGFSWAFRVLLNKVNTECYNVTGNAYDDNHMWNIARYNGGYAYFDCTFDRGRAGSYKYFAGTAEDYSVDHKWNPELFQELTKN